MAAQRQTPVRRALKGGRRTAIATVAAAIAVTALFAVRRTEHRPLVQARQPAAKQSLKGRVVYVVDGDSLHVQCADGRHKIRLAGIDAPEHDQPGYAPATRFVAGLAAGREVTLEVIDRDDYGRLVARVTLPDGRRLGEEIVGAGWAWWFRRHAPHDEGLAKLEREAREAHRGLWADPDPVAPWEHRARDWKR